MWKRTQSLLEHLSRKEQVHQVIFVNPEVWLMNLIFNGREQLSSNNSKLIKYSWKAVIRRKVSDKVTAITPFHFIPGSRTNRVLGSLQYRIDAWRLSRLIQKRDFILIVNDYNLNSFHRKLVQQFREKAKLVIFDWSDDFVEYHRVPEERDSVSDLCEHYIRNADVVLSINDDLTGKAKALNPHSYTILNGTDFEHLSKAVSSQWEIPRALRALSKPLIGFIGWTSESRIDLNILGHLSRTRSDWTIVLMGPVTERFKKLCGDFKNVVFLQPVNFEVLPQFLRYFDVCIIPNNVNDETRGNNPLKLYNYLAAGKPIVSTPVSGLESFRDVVYIAKDKEEFANCTERAIKEDNAERRWARMERAKENSWAVRVEELWKIIGQYFEYAP